MTRAGGSSEVAQDVFAAGCAHALAQGRIVQQLQHALGEGGRVAWWDEKAGLAIQHGFRRAAAVGADHRPGAGHGLQIDHPEAFEVRAADDDVGGCKDVLGVRAEAEIAQALAQQRVLEMARDRLAPGQALDCMLATVIEDRATRERFTETLRAHAVPLPHPGFDRRAGLAGSPG